MQSRKKKECDGRMPEYFHLLAFLFLHEVSMEKGRVWVKRWRRRRDCGVATTISKGRHLPSSLLRIKD
jgi:hypothetical protein